MNINTKSEQNVVLSEDVIAKMVAVAAKEVDGVCDLVPDPDFKKILSSKTKRTVSVKISQDSFVIDLFIKLKMGVNITTLCEAVQENVKKSIQNMTGRAVSKVNVHVVDIDIPAEE